MTRKEEKIRNEIKTSTQGELHVEKMYVFFFKGANALMNTTMNFSFNNQKGVFGNGSVILN